MTGYADEMLDEVVNALRGIGRGDLADRITSELIGLNVIAGRWSFQVVEDYDDGYYRMLLEMDGLIRDEVVGGRRHLIEAKMKSAVAPGTGGTCCAPPPVVEQTLDRPGLQSGSAARPDGTRLVGARDQLRSVPGVECAQQPSDVGACGGGADVEPVGDLGVGAGGTDLDQDLSFPLGEDLETVPRRLGGRGSGD